MKKILINDVEHLVDERFENYSFHKKPSSNVYVFGHSQLEPPCNHDVVVQFNNGGAYLYENVPALTVIGAISCESIGKYYRSEISGKHTGVKLDKQAVTAVKEEGAGV